MLAISLGLRRGEVLGLSWSDADLEAGRLKVRQQLERRDWRHGCADPADRGLARRSAPSGATAAWCSPSPRPANRAGRCR